jgi:hypothetical protein
VFLLASEVWAPLVTPSETFYTSEDTVVTSYVNAA